MNTKNLMATITEAVGGITSVLSSVVVLGIFSEIIFGAGVFGVDIVANIIGLIDCHMSVLYCHIIILLHVHIIIS